ncbi:MAG: DbpA RNA binding domain-containing protein, partial [Myxococcota bacterium]
RERPERQERTERAEEKTVPVGTAAVAPAEVAATPAVEKPAEQPKAPPAPPKKRLSDRELFELMQAGKPLPPIEDPTETSGSREEGGDRPRRERGERRDRRERKPREEVEVAPGNVRLWVNLGKADGLDEASISGALAGAGGPADKIAKVELRGTYSYVHVAEADAPAFEGLVGKQHGEKALKLERARR